MIDPSAHLIDDLFGSAIAKKSTRDGFGAGVVEAGKEDERIVVLSADLGDSTRANWFKKEFPKRFVEVGVAEQNLATVAAGMAAEGKIPFICSYAAFSPGRNYEQIRTTAALNHLPVKVCGMHAGIQTGPDGATHQMLEDIGLMRMLPNMSVFVPADAEEGRKCVRAAALLPGPSYLRFGRANEPVFTTPSTPFAVGKALRLWKHATPRVLFVTTGSVAYNALLAARALDAEGVGVEVLHFATVKPLDSDALVAAAARVQLVVTIEEHQVAGGFGGAVAETLSTHKPTRILRCGLQDVFGQSGDPDELMAYYGLSPAALKEVTLKTLRT